MLNASALDERGKEQTILATIPALIIAAMPMPPLPALLLITVSWPGLPVARKRSISAWISSTGAPEPPNPPIITVAPSAISATASSTVETVLSISTLFWFFDIYVTTTPRG